MKIQLLRHATMFIEIKRKQILLDPMLSKAGSMPAVPDVPNTSDNPLVDLPVELSSLNQVDAILLSHTHSDHFDDAAGKLLPLTTQVFCQPEDAGKIADAGFSNVQPVSEFFNWYGISIYRTEGQHGSGKIGQKMGPVSGYVLETDHEPSLYITGDTIWCSQVQDVLEKYRPQIIICFAGAARFNQGDPITMTKQDIYEVCRHSPSSKIIVVHMEAWNHCSLSRRELKEFIQKERLHEQVYIPDDGQCLDF